MDIFDISKTRRDQNADYQEHLIWDAVTALIIVGGTGFIIWLLFF